MSVRRNTTNRLSLIRVCHTCGRSFPTTAATPFMRQIADVGGKRQKTCYFCSEACKLASYKHLFDGKAAERSKVREAARDISEKNRRYYATHAEQVRRRAKERYWADPEGSRAAVAYQRNKRKLMEGAAWRKATRRSDRLSSTAPTMP